VRFGILGGTFDPIHLGHIAAARAALDCAQLDRVLFVPTGQPPHRRGAMAGAEQRLEMSRLAIAGEEKFQVSDLEVRRGGPSYTVDTLRELRTAHPDDELFLILGWDAARLFATWHQPDEVRRLASVVVVTRPGSPQPDARTLEAAGLDSPSTIVCARPTPDISGSALRRSIARGDLVGDRLPAPVESYIAKNKLYGDNRQVGG
jgi:nicotinate-nucleotide adenylyltransferase